MPDRANITTFVACERVIEEKGTGKKSVIGIFQNLSLRSLPSRLGGPWYVFAQLFGLDEEKVDITVNIVHDETQGVVFAAGLEMKQAHPPDVDIILETGATTFQKEGKHVVSMNINGTQHAYMVLNVSLARQEIGGQD